MAKFLGMPYPLQDHARGFMHTQFGTQQIKSDMLALLLTNPGERVMLPNYGVGLRKFLFEPNDALVIQEVTQAIDSQIRLWEPRIVIKNIEVGIPSRNDLNPADSLEDIESILLIRIEFLDPDNIQEIHELKLEVPLGGA